MRVFLTAGPVGPISVRDNYLQGQHLWPRPHPAPSSYANAEHAALAGDRRELVTTNTGRYRRNVGSKFGCEWAVIGTASDGGLGGVEWHRGVFWGINNGGALLVCV